MTGAAHEEGPATLEEEWRSALVFSAARVFLLSIDSSDRAFGTGVVVVGRGGRRVVFGWARMIGRGDCVRDWGLQ